MAIRMESKEVKSKSKIVGTATYPVYDSTAEAVEDKGEESILTLINTQTATNAKNAVRAAASPRSSKTAAREAAMGAIPGNRWAAVAGDPSAVKALIEEFTEIEMAKMKAGTDSAEVAAAADETEDED